MTDEVIVQLGVDSRQIRIILHNRPYPESSYAWDRDAITATVEVNTGAFQGRVPTMIWSHELEGLRHLLMNLYQQVGHEERVQFELREHTLILMFELTKFGHIEVRVEVSDMDPEYPAILTFYIKADQTYLPEWISEVRKSLEYFPKEL